MAARRIYTLMGAMLAGAAGLAPALAQDGGTESATVEALLACRAIAEAQARTACMDARLADFAAALDAVCVGCAADGDGACVRCACPPGW